MIPCQRPASQQWLAPPLPSQEPEVTVAIAFLVIALPPFRMSFTLVDLRVNFGLHLNCRAFRRRHVSLLAEHGTSTETGNRTVPPPTLQQTVYLVIFSQWVCQLHNLLSCNGYQHLVGHPWVIQWQTGDKDDERVSINNSSQSIHVWEAQQGWTIQGERSLQHYWVSHCS